MLATGGTLADRVRHARLERGAASLTAICLLAAPRGDRAGARAFPDDFPIPVKVVTAGLDERLNERGYIVPGLGDAGDRLFGAI